MGLFKKRSKESTPYSDMVLADRLVKAEGAVRGEAESATAVACAGIWARCLGQGVIDHPAVTAEVLSAIGYDLIMHGESVHLAEVRSGQVVLTRSSSWDVVGKTDWRYRLQLPMPGGTVTTRRLHTRAEVVHCRFLTDRSRPWRGLSPLRNYAARSTARIDEAVADEAAGPRGLLLAYPMAIGSQTDEKGKTLAETLSATVGRLKGGLVTLPVELPDPLMPAPGMAKAPGDAWTPRRLGWQVPQYLDAVRKEAVTSVAAACGVPIDLIGETKGSTGNRESLRQFLHLSLQAVGDRVAAELGRVLEADLKIDFDRLYASDIQGRARAWRSLVGQEAKMTPEIAARLVGIETDDA